MHIFVALTKCRPKGSLSTKERLKRKEEGGEREEGKKSRFQTAQIKKFVITTKLRSKATTRGPL